MSEDKQCMFLIHKIGKRHKKAAKDERILQSRGLRCVARALLMKEELDCSEDGRVEQVREETLSEDETCAKRVYWHTPW